MGTLFGRIAAGLGLGGFLGVLMALSATPVVASVVAALVSVIVSWLSAGLDPAKREARLPLAWSGAFGVGALLGVLLGLVVRTTDALSPSAAKIADDLITAGMDKAQAANIAAAVRYGVDTANVSPEKQRALSALLFNDKVPAEIEQLDPARVDGFASARARWEQAGGVFAALVRAIGDDKDLSESRKMAILSDVYAQVSESDSN